jgi:hypothetical protein
MRVPEQYRQDIADAVGDEFGWCEPEATGQKWCVGHGSVWLYGDRCDRARDVYLAAETAVESVLAAVSRDVKAAMPTACEDFGGPFTALEWVLDLLDAR